MSKPEGSPSRSGVPALDRSWDGLDSLSLQDKTPPSWRSPQVVGRVLLVVLSCGLLLGMAALGVHERDRDNERLLHEREGSHLVELQTSLINREFDSVCSDLLFLARHPRFNELSTRGDSAREELTQHYLIFAGEKGMYDQVRYLDPSGQEIVRINRRGGQVLAVPESELQDKSGRYYFLETIALGRGGIYVSSFDLNVEHGQIELPHKSVIRFSTPCFDEHGNRTGVVVLNYMGARWTDSLTDLAANAGGSAMLLNAEGYWLSGRTREEEWGFLLGTGRSFATSYPQAWERIAGSSGGQFLDVDGLYTFAALALPPRATETAGAPGARSLVILSHVPRTEVFARADRLLTWLLTGCGVVLALVAASSWLVIHAANVRHHQEDQIRVAKDRLQRLSKRLIDSQEEERARLARDLHDDLGQLATAATLQLQMALQLEGEQRTRRMNEAIESVESMLQRAREMASWLRPPMLDDLGLEATVETYLGELESRSGLKVRAELRLERKDLPTVACENLYRILQEALNNVVKYAGVSEVLVKVLSSERELTLIVRDEGVGFLPEALESRTLGILGMRERVDLLGGRFQLITAPGEGTEIRADLPLPTRDARSSDAS